MADKTSIDSVPSVRRGNDESHAIGLGQMNLHGYLGREHIEYGSEEGLDFTNAYFAAIFVCGAALLNKIARERGEYFTEFPSPSMPRANSLTATIRKSSSRRRRRSGAFRRLFDPHPVRPGLGGLEGRG